jgi:hypothetical protein
MTGPVGNFAVQNWVITPAAPPAGRQPPTDIHDQTWLLTLSGVVIPQVAPGPADSWAPRSATFLPDVGLPIGWAISTYGIDVPTVSRRLVQFFQLQQWALSVSLGSIHNESGPSGYSVDSWQIELTQANDPNTHQSVDRLFAGVAVNLAVYGSQSWIYRLGYTLTLLGKIRILEPIAF